MKKLAFITGATAGIGKSTAQLFAQSGYKLVITGRRADRLAQIKEELASEYDTEVETLTFDVRDEKAVFYNLNQWAKAENKIDVLVNNAGLASGLDEIQTGDSEDWNRMIDTNVKGLLYVTKACLPFIKRPAGTIINVGSLAGREVYRKGNVYCASKHAVDALTKGMRIDLLEEGIRVASVNPGLVETEFSVVRFHGDQQKADAVYQGFEPLHPEDIADAIYYVASRPAHVNISDILLTPAAQANAHHLLRKS